eukprot:5142186-Lingulodinium_polyedra.AAC.1
MHIPGAARMARAPQGDVCPQCSALLPVESFFANVYEDNKEFVKPRQLEIAATFAASQGQQLRVARVGRAIIRACVLCCLKWHNDPTYMMDDGRTSSAFRRQAQASKNWFPSKGIQHALDIVCLLYTSDAADDM